MPGARAFRLNITLIVKILGDTLAIRVQAWITVAGQDVFEVDALGLNRQVPANPAPKTVMRELISRVLAA